MELNVSDPTLDKWHLVNMIHVVGIMTQKNVPQVTKLNRV